MTNKKDMEALSWLADHTADAVCVTDREGRIICLNAEAARLGNVGCDARGENETVYFGAPALAETCAEMGNMTLFRKETPAGRVLDVTAFALAGKGKAPLYIVALFREREEVGTKADNDENILFIYKSSGMAHMMSLATKMAKIDSTVLINGESGTGKVMLARYIHHNSSRRGGAFVSLNCAAMSGELLEEELFGRAGGSGGRAKSGVIDMAAGGTLFLDEIDALPLFLQTRFLYDLHAHFYHPIGGRKAIPIDCRIVAATDRDLHQMVAKEEFREDLYYLINVFEVTIPPIRERTMDIKPMILHLVERYNRRYGLRRQLSEGALTVLTSYGWPGNIREMDNTIERLVAMAAEDLIDTHHLPDHIRFQAVADISVKKGKGSLDHALEELEKSIIRRSFEECGSSYEVARALSISQSKASRLIRKYCPSPQNRKKT